MPDVTSTSLQIIDQATAGNENTWGDIADSNFNKLEQAIAQISSIAVSGGSVSPDDDTRRKAILIFSGTLASNQIVIVANAQKAWHVKNNTTGNYTLTIKTAAGAGVVIPRGMGSLIYCDGTDVNVIRPGSLPFAVAGGTADALTASFTPALTSDALVDGLVVAVRAGFANATTTPTFNPDTLGAGTIKKLANQAVAVGDITGAGFVGLYLYNSATSTWTLLNPGSSILTADNVWTGKNYYQKETYVQSSPMVLPRGRLTLVTGTPVPTTDPAGIATIWYAPYEGAVCPLFDGSYWQHKPFSEVSQPLADTTKSPAATSANKAYDVFGSLDGSGNFQATRGPAWSTLTGRGTGAGTSELITVGGVELNKWDITNGPAAQRGTYLGSFMTNGSNQVDWVANPAAAAGGGNARIGLWNRYNRVQVSLSSFEGTSSWSFSGGPRAANNSNSNRITLFMGKNEDGVDATSVCMINYNGSNAALSIAIGLDRVNGNDGIAGGFNADFGINASQTVVAKFAGRVGLGMHYLQMVETSKNTGPDFNVINEGSPVSDIFPFTGITATTRM